MVVVFDLDFTLWDCGGTYCDCTCPPYTAKGKDITDSDGCIIRLYKDVVPVLEQLSEQGIQMGIASRTSTPDWAMNLLEMFDIHRFFAFSEIYPGSKITHFGRIAEKSRVPFNEMIFFDDEYRNIDEVGELGVNAVHVKNGLTIELHRAGMALLEANKKYV